MQHVLLVDDHHITAIGIGMVVKEVISEAVIYYSQTYQHALTITKSHPIDLIVLDLSMPDSIGTEMIAGFRRIRNEVKILICSGRGELLNAPAYLHKGANGYLHKNSSSDEPEIAIRCMLRNETYLSPDLRKQIFRSYISSDTIPSNPIEALTPKEKQVFDLMMTGKWTKEIAEELNVKHSTVSGYKAKILLKFNVTNVVDLVKRVVEILNSLD
jgi:DNA-binding NarL/FixJ family response regulator